MMHTSKSALTDKRYVVPFVLVTILFFLWGFARAILDVLNKHLQNEIHITITQSALIQVTTYWGYFVMAIPAGLFINRFGYRRGVVFGLLLFGMGALLFIPGAYIGTFYAFLGALFIIGCGLTFLETAANPYVTELGDRATATSRLNLSQSLVLIIAFVFSRVNLPEIPHPVIEEKENEMSGNFARLWRHKLFVFGLIALLAYEVAEISINSYFINFVTAQGWMNDNTASVVLTIALAFFMVGRFAGSWMMRQINARLVLLCCAVGCVVCIGLVLNDFGSISMVALIGNYLFEAIMFPTIFSLALSGLGNLTKSASSLLMMTPIGGCGFLLMGYVADHVGPVVPFLLPFFGYMIVLAYAVCLYKTKRYSKSAKMQSPVDKY